MMQENQPSEIVIVRRKPAWGEESVQHGVWKIAYADFMTAMMAFFLVMWLINVTDDSVRRGVAQYFNPVKLASTAPNQKGLNDPNVAGNTNEDGANQPEGDQGAGVNPETGAGGAVKGQGAAPGQFVPRHSEERLFNDPYAVLDTLAQTVAVDLGDEDMPTAVGAGQAREAGAQGGEAFRDPFDPLYWQFLPNRDLGSKRADTGSQLVRQVGDPGARSETLARVSTEGGLEEGEANAIVAHLAGSEPGEGDFAGASGVTGYRQIEVTALEVREQSPPNPDVVAERLQEVLRNAAQAGLGETVQHVSVSRSDDGILISLTDDQAFGMFAIGSAEPRPELVKLVGRLGQELTKVRGEIVIKGHTDGRPFKTKTYDNWRLSSARAHMALYMLTRGGVDPKRFERVEGYADRVLKLPADPYAAANRRVEILIRETD